MTAAPQAKPAPTPPKNCGRPHPQPYCTCLACRDAPLPVGVITYAPIDPRAKDQQTIAALVAALRTMTDAFEIAITIREQRDNKVFHLDRAEIVKARAALAAAGAA